VKKRRREERQAQKKTCRKVMSRNHDDSVLLTLLIDDYKLVTNESDIYIALDLPSIDERHSLTHSLFTCCQRK
jgi:hypothetical protein